MLVRIEDVKVKNRVRKDMGDISALAESMKRFGQINPIVITKKNVLAAGGRRLEAARFLGWKSINAVMADIPDDIGRLEYELEENIQRQDFSREEEQEAEQRLAKLKNPSLFRRIINAMIKFFKRIFGIRE
jgi:ParB family chromosome partitioning protein